MARYFMELTQTKGTVLALARATEVYKSDSRFRGGCHDALHAIGRTAAQEFTNTGEAFQYGTFLCWSGYYHGVIEGKLRGANAKMLTPATFNMLCAPNEQLPLGSFVRFHCTHALGHAIMYRTNYDLPKTLSHCSSLERDFDKHQCASGAFMENYAADGKEHKTSWQPTEDLTFPCKVTDQTYANECSFVSGMFAMKQFANDEPRSFLFCSSLTQNNEQIECGAGVGKVIADNVVFDEKISREKCLSAPKEFREACFFGAIQEIVGIDANPRAGETFCATLLGEELNVCKSTVNKVRTTLGL